MNDEIKRTMIMRAREAMNNAWAPYSGFKVGAALLAEGGGIFSGCNVENSSYPVGCCAERNAIGAAVAAGETTFKGIVITTTLNHPATPCGMCRQAMAEFGLDWQVICVAADDTRISYTVGELLPDAFDSSSLGGTAKD